jgi:hypothetical protein
MAFLLALPASVAAAAITPLAAPSDILTGPDPSRSSALVGRWDWTDAY